MFSQSELLLCALLLILTGAATSTARERRARGLVRAKNRRRNDAIYGEG